jgi:GTP diphosphokinase / guanosine-3',5'-bis(diphosphate) 3'-diphosphatase
MIAEKELQEIESRFHQLRQICKDCSSDDLQKLDKAYAFAGSIYEDRRKPSGEPMIMHGLSVATIVADEIGLRSGSVVASLLHDITDYTDDDCRQVEEQFGFDIATIVRGFKKISLFRSDKVKLHSENFRSLFLSMIDDVRIIFIKLAHRLHDMRNYDKLPEDLKKIFLNDVTFLYIPIAHRLGLYQIKAELEDLSFKYNQPEEYSLIASRLDETREQQEKYITGFIKPVKKQLDAANLKYEIKSRTKTISSIKKKIETQGVTLDQIYDLFAIRIILTNVLKKEEEAFLSSFKDDLQKFGDLRNVRRKKAKEKEEKKGKKTSSNIHQQDVTGDLQILNEIREKELRAFECKHKRYLKLLTREKTACWQVYSIITNIYQPNPKRFRDWITTPKNSGYESLHTTVLGNESRWVEVQIRSARMDEDAETGNAAHWKYKESAYGKNIDRWMLDVRNQLETIGAQKLDERSAAKIDTGTDKIYVFTPNGDVRELKNGATVLDYAFDIHTDLGCKCIGGKIGGKIFPIRHHLSNGDKVEIVTAKNQRPHSDWLNFVTTTKAKSRISRSLREEKYKEAEVGKDILNRKLKNWKIELNDHELSRILKYFNFRKPVDLYYNIAIEKIDVQEIKMLFKAPEEIEERIEKKEKEFDFEEQLESQSEKDHGYITIDSGVSQMNYSLAKCCNPIAGDRIFAFVTVNQGIKIHRYNCPNAKDLLTRFNYRVRKAKWKETKSMKFFVTNLRIVGIDRVGLVNDITKAISEDLKVNMKGINFKSLGSSFEGLIKVQVRDAEHLSYLRQKLLKIKGVIKVGRFD